MVISVVGDGFFFFSLEVRIFWGLRVNVFGIGLVFLGFVVFLEVIFRGFYELFGCCFVWIRIR